MPDIFPDPEICLDPTPTPEIPLPKGWTQLTLQAVLHIISLARMYPFHERHIQ